MLEVMLPNTALNMIMLLVMLRSVAQDGCQHDHVPVVLNQTKMFCIIQTPNFIF